MATTNSFPSPPVRSPFLGNPPTDSSPKNFPSWGWLQWFQAVTTALSAIPNWPAGQLSSAPNNGYGLAKDANFLYVFQGTKWTRIPLNSF